MGLGGSSGCDTALAAAAAQHPRDGLPDQLEITALGADTGIGDDEYLNLGIGTDDGADIAAIENRSAGMS